MYQRAYKIFFGLDIAGFNHVERDDQACVTMRQVLYNALDHGLDAAAISCGDCDLLDRGDGIMSVLNPTAGIVTVLHAVVPALMSVVDRYNSTASAADLVRLRAVLHCGDVLQDARGYIGKGISHAFRLLDSPELRAKLATSVTNLALAVSASAWAEMGSTPSSLGGFDFANTLVSTKEHPVRAWLTTLVPDPLLTC